MPSTSPRPPYTSIHLDSKPLTYLGDHRLARPRGPIEQHTAGRGDADGAEQLRVAQGQLDQLPNHGQLLLAAPNVVVPDLVEPLVVLALVVLS